MANDTSTVRQFVERVDVSDQEIRISGPKTALLDGLARQASSQMGKVPSLGMEWWCWQSSANSSLTDYPC